VYLIGDTRRGEASPAAAGILGASLEDTHGPTTSAAVHDFAVAARDRYATYLPDLVARSGVSVPFNRNGVLQLAFDETAADALRRTDVGQWLDKPALSALEPAVGAAVGALLFERDGSVDNVAMLRALRDATNCASQIERIEESVASIATSDESIACTLAPSGETYRAPRVVLAAGAWVAGIPGVPHLLPVDPLRGQMLAVGAPMRSRPRHVIYGPSAYVVPRGERILIGATLERVGFDPSTTPSALAALRAGGVQILPGIADAPALSSWAGLRPATPDLLPIIGPDPDAPALIYACGHSRNGILMAPLTADCVAAIVAGDRPPVDVSPFRVERFPLAPVRFGRASSSSE
jgi:glycine oxidase